MFIFLRIMSIKRAIFYEDYIFHLSCNPSHLGVENPEDQGLKPALAKSSRDPISTDHWA
jgi:hypothetical protein